MWEGGDGRTDGWLTFGYSMCSNVTVGRGKQKTQLALSKFDACGWAHGARGKSAAVTDCLTFGAGGRGVLSENCEKRLLASSCPHATTLGTRCNLSSKFRFHYNLTRLAGILHQHLCTYVIIYRAFIFLEWQVFAPTPVYICDHISRVYFRRMTSVCPNTCVHM